MSNNPKRDAKEEEEDVDDDDEDDEEFEGTQFIDNISCRIHSQIQ